MLYLIDTNVLVFMIVGFTDPNLVYRHSNCKTYLPEHLAILSDMIGPEPKIIVTPHIAAETNSLLFQIGNPDKNRIANTFQRFLTSGVAEHYCPSAIASRRLDFKWRGVTDCAIIELRDPEFHLVTADHLLYQSFLADGRLVTNFRHVIDNAGV